MSSDGAPSAISQVLARSRCVIRGLLALAGNGEVRIRLAFLSVLAVHTQYRPCSSLLLLLAFRDSRFRQDAV